MPAQVGQLDARWVGHLSAAQFSMVLVVGLALLFVLCYLLRRRWLDRHLGSRVEVELVPSDDFDPATCHVINYAARLARARPASRRGLAWPTPRAARAIRLSLVTDADAVLHHRVSGPAAAAALLAAPAYPQVDTRVLTDEPEIPTMTAWRHAAGLPAPAPAEMEEM